MPGLHSDLDIHAFCFDSSARLIVKRPKLTSDELIFSLLMLGGHKHRETLAHTRAPAHTRRLMECSMLILEPNPVSKAAADPEA